MTQLREKAIEMIKEIPEDKKYICSEYPEKCKGFIRLPVKRRYPRE